MSLKEKVKLTYYSKGGGWACKIGPGDLAQVLSKINKHKNDNVIVDFEQSDDAAVIDIGSDKYLVQTVDFFSPIVDDPYTFGQIAAANSLSDIYAMGAKPLFALNIVGFPTKELSNDILAEILKGGASIASKAGIPIVGGHSVDDSEIKYGLVVTGEVKKNDLIKNSNAKHGDLLLLTKPLGTGILYNALKKGVASYDDFHPAIKSMVDTNKEIGSLLNKFNVNAATDVTGYGLIGHLYEMCRAGNVSAEIETNKVPFFNNVEQFAKKGAVPGGTSRNLEFFSKHVEFKDSIQNHQKLMLADAQTSGGLLISLSEKDAYSLSSFCNKLSIGSVQIIGKFTSSKNPKIVINL